MSRMVTVKPPDEEPYRGYKRRVTHELSIEGRTERVWAIQTENGYRYARHSWIKGHGARTESTGVQ